MMICAIAFLASASAASAGMDPVPLQGKAAAVRINVSAGESLVSVRNRVREMPAAEKSNGVEIVLAPGEYFLPDGMELTAKDGGASASAPVVWRSAEPGKARIVGARRIPAAAFRKVTNKDFLSRIPEEGRDRVYAADVSEFCPAELPEFATRPMGLGCVPEPPAVFIDGRVGLPAQWPNGRNSWVEFSQRVDQGVKDEKRYERFLGGAFVFHDQRPARWDFSNGVWLCGYFTHDWVMSGARAASWGTENGTNDVMRIAPDSPVPYGVMSGTWGQKERRFRAVNLLEELDDTGEWWLDRKRKVLFVVPPEGRMSDTTDVRIAFSEKTLLRGGNLSNVRFEGIAFCANYGRLVNFVRSDGIVISDCAFSCAVDTAVAVAGMRNRVVGCEVFECGSSGIFMSGGDRTTLTPSESSIEGCRIHDYAVFQRTYSMAAKFDGCGLALRGCEICDAPHMAMRYEANDCVIESNDVHHVLMETGDAGAFYSGRDWTTQGNVIRGNFIHDIGQGTTSREGADGAVSGTNAMALYFDDCDCGDEVVGNVFMNCPRGIMVGGGREHPIRNNVFIGCRLGMSIDCRGYRWKVLEKKSNGWALEERAQRLGYTNGVWAARYPRLARIMDEHPCEPLYNPVEDNLFVDCDKVISIEEVIKCNDDGTAPGILSRMAPIRRNTVVYTQGTNIVRRQVFDPRIASGFTVFNGR